MQALETHRRFCGCEDVEVGPVEGVFFDFGGFRAGVVIASEGVVVEGVEGEAGVAGVEVLAVKVKGEGVFEDMIGLRR